MHKIHEYFVISISGYFLYRGEVADLHYESNTSTTLDNTI